jgi:hypothetical protein
MYKGNKLLTHIFLFQSKLKIKGLRYQNDFQWVKVTHLGNGMTGKCHLANDFETDFKFCVKEVTNNEFLC